jgi:type II secretory pathway component PulM
VQLEGASFDAMIEWLGTLDLRYGLAIESITIDRTAQPGIVNASVTLNQPAH